MPLPAFLRAAASLTLCAACAASPRGPSAAAQARLAAHESARLVPLLLEVLRFHTVQGDTAARAAQQEWLRSTARSLGLTAREALISRREQECYSRS